MTYKLNKIGKDKYEWVGFCDGCQQPFKPNVADASIFRKGNTDKVHFDIKYLLGLKEIEGYCLKCCNNLNYYGCGNPKYLNVFEVDDVKVV